MAGCPEGLANESKDGNCTLVDVHSVVESTEHRSHPEGEGERA